VPIANVDGQGRTVNADVQRTEVQPDAPKTGKKD